MRQLLLLVLLLAPLSVSAAAAQPVGVYLEPLGVASQAATDQSTASLRAVVAARLAKDGLQLVATPAQAQCRVNGTFVQVGNQYAMDLYARSAAGEGVARQLVQGTGGLAQLTVAATAVTDKLAAALAAQPFTKGE